MKGFSVEVQRNILECQNGRCKAEGCYEPISDFHHKLPQTKVNIRLFPLFIHSPFNCAGLCRNEHTNNSHLYKVTIQEAEVYELWLREFKEKGAGG
jgi:hypothetical protein